MSLSEKLLASFDEAQYKSSSGKTFEVPAGKWKHIKKSAEWEKNNENDAKGKVGSFSSSNPYLEWQSDDGKSSMSIDVKELQGGGSSLHFKAKSGMEYWFQKA
jgi:hypothetical protein